MSWSIAIILYFSIVYSLSVLEFSIVI